MALLPPHPAHSYQNCCNICPKNAKNGLKTRQFALFFATWVTGQPVDHLKSFRRPQSTIVALWVALASPHPAHSCQNCCTFHRNVPKVFARVLQFTHFALAIKWTHFTLVLFCREIFVHGPWGLRTRDILATLVNRVHTQQIQNYLKLVGNRL